MSTPSALPPISSASPPGADPPNGAVEGPKSTQLGHSQVNPERYCLHASALVEALLERRPDSEVFGLGGDRLVSAGLQPIAHQSELAVAGLVEVLSSARRVLGVYASLRRTLRDRRPDLAIFVDSPDLNLPLAAVAARLGIPSLYYIVPQVWAWRFGRVRKLRRRVRHAAVIFPFEAEILEEADVPVTFVGHPLVDRMEKLRRSLRPAEVARDLGLDLGRPVLGLLPGSRRNEVAANLPPMLEAARLVRGRYPDLQVVVLVAPTLRDSMPPIPDFARAVHGRTHEAMAISTCLVVAPGTATVEAALLGVPLVVLHSIHPLSFEIARRITRVPSTCMVNLLADEGIVPERVQEMARPAAIAALVGRLVRSEEAREAMRARLGEVADASSMLEQQAIKFIYFEFNDIYPRSDAFGGALTPIDEWIRPHGYRFIASYNDYVVTNGELFLVSNALYVLPPK